jgi:diacylglycerol kinase (ATP)
MGGDGTIEAVARELIGTRVRLGLLPGGTENNLAKALGIPEDLPSACRLISEGTCKKIDAGQIKTQKGKKLYFLELAAVGLIADLFPEGKGIAQGKWGKLGTVMSKFAQYEQTKVKVKLDKQNEMAVDSLLVTISNAPAFGQGFLVAPTASMDDGLLDINLYPNLSKAEVAAYFVEIAGEKGIGNPKVEHYQARKIILRTDPKQPIMADGIMLGKGKVKIKACRNILRVISGTQPKPVKNANLDKEEKLPAPVTPALDIQKTEPVK